MKSENSGSVAVPESAGGSVPPTGQSSKKILKLRIEAVPFGSTVVLRCQAYVISRDDARSLSGIISEVLPSAKRMVIDLAGVSSLDSDALGELVLTHMWAEAAHYSLKFSSPSDAVRRLFEATNLVSVLDVYPSATDALAAMHYEDVHSA